MNDHQGSELNNAWTLGIAMIGFLGLGCGGARPAPQGPPDVTLKEAGSGWYCAEKDDDTAGPSGLCRRTAERCAKFGYCPPAPQPIAWCMTYTAGGDRRSWCTGTESSCNSDLALKAENPADSAFSTCAAWD